MVTASNTATMPTMMKTRTACCAFNSESATEARAFSTVALPNSVLMARILP